MCIIKAEHEGRRYEQMGWIQLTHDRTGESFEKGIKV
jgi:hypothetical protein